MNLGESDEKNFDKKTNMKLTSNNFGCDFDNNIDNSIKEIEEYMKGELKLEYLSSDASYEWVKKDDNICELSKGIKSEVGGIKSLVKCRDTVCELKVNNRCIL